MCSRPLKSLFICALALSSISFISATSQSNFEHSSTDSFTTSVNTAVSGVWEVDSTIFVNNGDKGEAGPPLVPTQWHLLDGGVYQMTGAGTIGGTYTSTENTLTITSMGMTIEYSILEISDTHLALQSYIVKTAEMEMKALTYLTKAQ